MSDQRSYRVRAQQRVRISPPLWESLVCASVHICISSLSLSMANLMHLGLMTIRVLPLTLSADNFTIPLSVLTKMLQYGILVDVRCNYIVSVIVCELLV